MNDTTGKSGPIHFYPTEQRDAGIAHVVEYCVQIGDRQPLTRSQAAWLVSDQQVTVDGRVVSKLNEKVAQGTWEVTIRGRKHHVVVHPAFFE
jgi:hypothetical protein